LNPLIDPVSRILHSDDVHFEINVQIAQELMGSSYVFCVGMKINKGFGLAVVALEYHAGDEILRFLVFQI
jgi:hypothetical protein